jgi:prolyl 4-hydroxylase
MSSYEGFQSNGQKSYDQSNSLPINHFIRVYDQIISDQLVEEMIEHLHNRCNYVDSDFLRRHEVSVYDPNMIEKIKGLSRLVYEKYKQDIGMVGSNLFQCNHLESPVIAQYQPSNKSLENKKEHFHDHADCWHFDSGTRVISMIYYLNDVLEGGETHFTQLGQSIQPKKGRVLVFPSNFIYMHRANPPISNNKYVCICWIHFDGNTIYSSSRF